MSSSAGPMPQRTRPIQSSQTKDAPKPTHRSRRTPLWAAIALWATTALIGCAFGEIRPHDPMDRQISLEDRHKDYTDLVRWSKFRAAAAFVKPAERTGFLDQMPDSDEVRFTDWEAEEWQFEDPETMDRAIIEVSYRGYSMHRPFEVKVHEQQEWTREGRANHWNVVSRFLDLETLIGP